MRNEKWEIFLKKNACYRTYLFNPLECKVIAITSNNMKWGFSRRIKIPRCNAYDIGESNPVPASWVWSGSGSKVNQFVYVPTPVDTQNVIQIDARVFE